MGDNLPLHAPMSVSEQITKRAKLAIEQDLQTLAYAYPDIDVEVLRHDLGLAYYRQAMLALNGAPPDTQVPVEAEAEPVSAREEFESATFAIGTGVMEVTGK